MKSKYQKEKQTDASALLSILTMSISLALSPDHATPASQAWHDPNVTNHNTQSSYTDFPGPEKYKKTSLNVYFYPLYADTVPLNDINLATSRHHYD